MIPLAFTLVLLFSSLSLAAEYSFKESHFSVDGFFIKTDPVKDPIPAFNFTGRALLIEDADKPYQPTAQITIRRTTYDCDDVNFTYKSEFSCSLSSAKFLQILDEVASRQGPYDAAIAVLKNFFKAHYYDDFTISMGSVGQTIDEQTRSEFIDPLDIDASVETTVNNSGLTPLRTPP
jgi:hypothetical protein